MERVERTEHTEHTAEHTERMEPIDAIYKALFRPELYCTALSLDERVPKLDRGNRRLQECVGMFRMIEDVRTGHVRACTIIDMALYNNCPIARHMTFGSLMAAHDQYRGIFRNTIDPDFHHISRCLHRCLLEIETRDIAEVRRYFEMS